MATFKSKGGIEAFQKKLVDGMTQRGYSEEFSLEMFEN